MIEIWSLSQVKSIVETRHNIIVSKRLMANLLKNQFDMRFHKVKRV